MDPIREKWNIQHKELRQALSNADSLKTAINLFLIQHAMVHSVKMSNSNLFSFEDEILADINDDKIRAIPTGSNHSIVWILWHLARIEDVTMNLLVAGGNQVFTKSIWSDKIKAESLHTGNGMSDSEIKKLSSRIDTKRLKAYRIAVGRQTRKIVKTLNQKNIKQGVNPAYIQRVWDEKAMLKKGRRVVDYWAKRDIAGLLLMPPTRHCILHLNEARRIKEKIINSQ